MVGNVSYVSGGIGEDSRERMKAFSAAFNLKLLFAYKSGSYMSDVDVVVADAKGKPLIKASSEGPIFMARLPAGAYEGDGDRRRPGATPEGHRNQRPAGGAPFPVG